MLRKTGGAAALACQEKNDRTGCGFTTFTDDEMNAKLKASIGDASPAPMRFYPEENTGEQIRRLRPHPWIAKEVPVRGFVSDVHRETERSQSTLEEERAA